MSISLDSIRSGELVFCFKHKNGVKQSIVFGTSRKLKCQRLTNGHQIVRNPFPAVFSNMIFRVLACSNKNLYRVRQSAILVSAMRKKQSPVYNILRSLNWAIKII